MLTFAEIVANSKLIRDEAELRTIVEQLEAKGLVRAIGTEFRREWAEPSRIYELTEAGLNASRRSQ